MRINQLVQYFGPDGRPTDEGMKFFLSLESRLSAISNVTAPSGGITTDAEARTAINAIITAAG